MTSSDRGERQDRAVQRAAPRQGGAARNDVRQRPPAAGGAPLPDRSPAQQLPETDPPGLRAALASLTSLVVHLLLIVLLGVWWLTPPPQQRPLRLVTELISESQGEVAELEEPEVTMDVEDPGDVDVSETELDDPLSVVELELPVAAPEPVGDEPDPREQEGNLFALADSVGSMFQGRDPRSRAHLVREAGGSRESEEAVALGLQWLARHQNYDGSWSLHAFNQTGECNGQCGHTGTRSDTAGTALALLPFLGAGQTHRTGEFQDVVGAGLQWLVKHQRRDGDLCGEGTGRMYAHGQAAIALCEAYALTQDPWLKEPAQAALDFIIAAQHPLGGWRYVPGQAGDTSVVGWQVMALRSGQMAYLNVPSETLERAQQFLDSVATDSIGSEYGYQPGRNSTPSMTAEALLCRQYLGWPRNHPGLVQGGKYLVRRLPSRRSPNIYYWYYGTQVMHHLGGTNWDVWNHALRDMLIAQQEKQGHEAGSWAPRLTFDAQQGGRLYTTALSICILEVYYRHMPLYADHAITR